MKTTKTTATITLLVAAAIAMAACTPTTPTDPTGSATASPTTSESPSPTATAGAAPVQDPVPAPTTQQEAITSATKAIENYLVASFAVDENPDLGVEYLRGFLVQGGAEQKVISDTVAHNLENGWHKTGSPTTWTTNDATSYASQTTNAATGEKFEFGAAIIYGCGDNSGWDIEVPAGQTPPAIQKGSFPRQWTMVYEQNEHIWLVQESVSLTGKDGAPTC